ncbi:lantibiotic dehydratase [Staphylococcus lutrae]|uniref:lantibiotic dehydratase n=1 Tax=Staphylococcus lutrae TaxID=155085 RepID=UPI00146D452F|nr:lantibiotic dehydratase [Staphylococcus lutrae]
MKKFKKSDGKKGGLMYDLLNIVCIRMANNSRSTTNSYLEKQIFTSSRSLYEQIYSKNKGEMNYKAEHALRNYMKRSIYRATPYRLLSSFKFLDIKASNSMLKNYISINNNFKVYTNIDSLWLKNYISSLKINNLGHLLFKCNENVINITEIYIYNEWNSSKKILKTSNNIIITEILNFTKSPKSYKEISNHLNHLFASISKNVVECILIELLKTELLLTNLDQKIYYHNFQALDRFLKEESLNYNKHTHNIIIKNINKINTTVDKLDINIIKEIEKCLKSIAESSSYLNFDTESNINHFNIDMNRIKKDFNSFVKFIQKYASRKDYDKRYRADVLFLLDRFGDGIVKFTDFYSDYTQVRQKHLYMANNYDDIFLYLKKEISILSEISKLQRSQSIDLSHLKLNNFDENKKYSPSFHLSVNIFSKDGKTLKYNLSDYICKNGIAKSEGRLSYINKNIYSNLRYIDESIFKMNNLKTISINYFPKNPYFINIMKDFCESEYSFSMNSWAKNDEFDIENLYIKVIDGKIFLLEVKNSNIEIVSFNQYNVANALDLAPELVKDLLYWSDNYFADSYSLFYDLQSIRNNHIVFPEIKYENITLFPKSWILNLMIENKLKKNLLSKNYL